MAIDELPRQGKPDAETASAGSLTMLPDLREHVEQRVELIRRQAEARIPHAHDDVVGLDARRDRDLPSGLRILCGVAQQIADYLRQTLEVAFGRQRQA